MLTIERTSPGENGPIVSGGYPTFVMDLDHRPGTIKLHEPNRLYLVGSVAVVKAELAKCDAVCSNCHRIRTHERKTWLGRDYVAEQHRLSA